MEKVSQIQVSCCTEILEGLLHSLHLGTFYFDILALVGTASSIYYN